jgi:hypothetical protein
VPSQTVSGQTLFHILFGVFIVLHGLIHLVYAGHSVRLWEAKPGMDWPNESWAFSRRLGNSSTRRLAAVTMLLVAGAFGTGGVGTISSQPWSRPLVVGAAGLSALAYCLLWNGRRQNLAGQGLVGIVISVAILALALAAQ